MPEVTINEIPVLFQISLTEDGVLHGADVVWRTIVRGPANDVISRSDRGPVPMDLNDRETMDRVFGAHVAGAMQLAALETEARSAAEARAAGIEADYERIRVKESDTATVIRSLRGELDDVAVARGAPTDEPSYTSVTQKEMAATQQMSPTIDQIRERAAAQHTEAQEPQLDKNNPT